MPKIFVSYRRVDAQERAHRIADWLVLKYGKENVFIDVDTIHGGEDFVKSIEDSLAQTDVLLIVIGDKWVFELNARAIQPDVDFVRLEVRTGLDRIPLVIPLLTNQNIDIRATQLPDDIKPMMRRNFRFARGGRDFHRDMSDIKDEIDKRFPPETKPADPTPEPNRNIPFVPIIALLFVVGVMIAFAIMSSQNGDNAGIVIADATEEVTQVPIATDELTLTDTDEPSTTPTDEPSNTPTETDEPSPEPSNTPEPTATTDIEAEALTVVAVQATQQFYDEETATAIEHSNETATATQWTDTPTPDVTASIDAKLTQWSIETATQSAVETATQFPLDLTATATLWTETRLPTFTSTVTFTPSYTPTHTPTQVELSQSAIIDGPEFFGSISVSYPEGWGVQSEGSAIIVANSEDTLELEDPFTVDEIPAGSVMISLSIITGEMAGAVGLTEEPTPAEVIELLASFMGGEGMPEFGDVEELEIDGNAAARTTVSDDTIFANLYVVEKDGNFTFGFGATHPDEADQFADTIQAIISSATLTATE